MRYRAHMRGRAAIPALVAGSLLVLASGQVGCHGGGRAGCRGGYVGGGSVPSPAHRPRVASPAPRGSRPGVPAAEHPTPATPPRITLFYPGAPCALVNPGPAAPGPCRGSEDDDTYLPFELPANRGIEVAFDQPIDPTTLVLATACGAGNVRIEKLGEDGACTGVVSGMLSMRERGLRFVPSAPWTPGRVYRVVLVPGTDADCDPGDICGLGGLPLDTNPLAGAGAGEGGGPPAAVAFTAVPPSDHAWLTLSTRVPAGAGDAAGIPDDDQNRQSRVAIAITDTGGVVTSASFDQADCLPDMARVQGCSYLTADLAASIGPLQVDCTAPGQAGMCIPVRIHPGIIYGTSLTIDANVIGLGLIDDLRTGPLLMRLREGDAPSIGYIVGSPDGSLRFIVDLDLYLDAPDLSILGGLASHDLRSKPISLALAGPVALFDDGRIAIELTNREAEILEVDVSALFGGSIRMQIPANTARIHLRRALPTALR